MDRSGEIDTEANRLLWTIGWNWVYVFIGVPILAMILGVALDGFLSVLSFLLFFIGPVVAVVGLYTVRTNYKSVLDEGTTQVAGESSEVARLDADNTEQFSLITDYGDSQFLLPAPKREVATLIVSDSLLLVHDDANVDLPGLSWSVGESINEFYYDQISGVNYDPFDDSEGGEFWVNLSDGHGQSWVSNTGAESALSEVQSRIRSYKAQ